MTTIDRENEIIEISVSPIFTKSEADENETNISDDTFLITRAGKIVDGKYIEPESIIDLGTIHFNEDGTWVIDGENDLSALEQAYIADFIKYYEEPEINW